MTSRALLLFSSARGQTRRVCRVLAAPHAALDLMELTPEPPRYSGGHDVVIFASPTYGQGELHHVWTTHLPQLIQSFGAAPPTQGGLLVLGDRRYHGHTFAGAVNAFHRHLRGTPLAPLLGRICVVDPRENPAWQQHASAWLDVILQEGSGGPYDDAEYHH